jgi:hypothetical protein
MIPSTIAVVALEFFGTVYGATTGGVTHVVGAYEP